MTITLTSSCYERYQVIAMPRCLCWTVGYWTRIKREWLGRWEDEETNPKQDGSPLALKWFPVKAPIYVFSTGFCISWCFLVFVIWVDLDNMDNIENRQDGDTSLEKKVWWRFCPVTLPWDYTVLSAIDPTRFRLGKNWEDANLKEEVWCSLTHDLILWPLSRIPVSFLERSRLVWQFDRECVLFSYP